MSKDKARMILYNTHYLSPDHAIQRRKEAAEDALDQVRAELQTEIDAIRTAALKRVRELRMAYLEAASILSSDDQREELEAARLTKCSYHPFTEALRANTTVTIKEPIGPFTEAAPTTVCIGSDARLK